MTVGQIQRNYIQQNSIGVGFFGYSGFSGFSGQAGVIGLPAGALLWIDDVLIFDSLNGFYTYGTKLNGPSDYWQLRAINDGATVVGPTANWKDGIAIPGFVTKIRARALITDGFIPSGIGNETSCFWAMRIRQLTAVSAFYGLNPTDINPDWSNGFSDTSVLVWNSVVYYGPLVPGAIASAVWNGRSYPMGASMKGFSPSGLETPWATLPGDGSYMVEVKDYHFGNYLKYGWVPDKIYIEFAKVKS